MKNKYRIYPDSATGFTNILQALNNAKHSIYIETFALKEDSIGRKIIATLLRKAKECSVTIIVDSFGSSRLSKKTRAKLEQSSIQYLRFNKIFHRKNFRLGKIIERMSTRNHRKLIIVDKKTAFVGSLNLNEKHTSWHDYVVRIQGPLVKKLVSSAQEILRVVYFSPWTKKRYFKQLDSIPKNADYIARNVPFSPRGKLNEELLKLITKARQEITIITPYLIIPPAAFTALSNASKRGIKITIIIPEKSDHWATQLLSRYYALLCHRKGMNILLHDKMIHAKLYVADKSICSFGSSNLDFLSWRTSYELNVFSRESLVCKAFQKYIKKESQHCISFDPTHHYKKRPQHHKLLEPIVRLFKKRF